jgi:hypothetical protein
LRILGGLSTSRLWDPYLLDDHCDAFATSADLRDWLGPLLKSNYAKKAFGWRASAEYDRIAWKTGLYTTENPDFIPRTVNLLVMRGKPVVHGLAKVVSDALEAKQRNTDTTQINVKMELVVLNELVKFLEDVAMHAPNGWGDVVTSKAKTRLRRKVAKGCVKWGQVFIQMSPIYIVIHNPALCNASPSSL